MRLLHGVALVVVLLLFSFAALVGLPSVAMARDGAFVRSSGGVGAAAVGAAAPAGMLPVYRFRNTVTEAFAYAADAEMKTIMDGDPDTYDYQGVAFWLPVQSTATLPIYWFYHPDIDGDFFTINDAERDSVIDTMPWYLYLGEYLKANPLGAPNVTLWRLRDTASGSYLYTARDEEVTAARAVAGSRYILEGPAMGVGAAGSAWDPTIGARPESPLQAVYRFFNFQDGVHFYTANPAEKDNLAQYLFWALRYEGVAYSINNDNPNNCTPLYRFYNLRTKVHFYTASTVERDLLVAKFSSTYRLEGEAYKVCATPVAGAFPVYRFYNVRKGVHFYTSSEAEKASVIQKFSSTFRFEGPAFFVAP